MKYQITIDIPDDTITEDTISQALEDVGANFIDMSPLPEHPEADADQG